MTARTLYDALGFSPPYSIVGEEDIRKAWRDRVRENHPDKGGDEEFVKLLNRAKEVLLDPTRRQQYDEELDTQPSRVTPSAVSAPIQKTVCVTLEEVYSSAIKTVEYTRLVTVLDTRAALEGSGCCAGCCGMGVVKQAGTQTCYECGGTGKRYGMMSEIAEVRVTLEPGTYDGRVYVYPEVGNKSAPHARCGDVHVMVRFQAHPIYTVISQYDIQQTVRIDIVSALCGHCVTVQHLNGKDTYEVQVNKVTEAGETVVLKGYGLPKPMLSNDGFYQKNRFVKEYGDLRIVFQVEFPRELTEHQKRGIREVFRTGLRVPIRLQTHETE